MECMTTVQYSLLVNGSISMSFKLDKGLRQGDLLSPYLFLMCANVLSLSLQKTEHEKLINGVRVGRMAVLSLICYLLMIPYFSSKMIISLCKFEVYFGLVL